MIYFITARDESFVKIGYADDPQSRFHTIQTHCPLNLTLERVLDGDRSMERALHVRFASSRVRGEWFELTSEISDFMAPLEEHEWKRRGWHHAAKRQELAANASRKRPEQDCAA